MNVFCGCDPEALAELAERLRERAQRLRELIELLRETSAAVTWVGPDADAHRRRTDSTAAKGLAVAADLRAAAVAARRHAWEQEQASQADSLAAVRAGLPGLRGAEPGPRRSGILEEPGPWIGGPLQAEDPQDLFPGLAPVQPPPGGWGPLLGGPFMWPPGAVPPPENDPLPEGEEFALDPEFLAEAEEDRRSLLGAIPVVGTIQTAMDVHEEVGGFHDSVDEALADAGLEQLQPLADLSRVPHIVTAPLLGEDSVVGQIAEGADRTLANVFQTGSEVTDALGEGDWGAAARAAERGMFRGWGTSAEVLTASPLPAVAESGADLLGGGADVLRPLSPEAADRVDGLAEEVRGHGEGFGDFLDSLTDAETWYDARREHAPLPWDPQG